MFGFKIVTKTEYEMLLSHIEYLQNKVEEIHNSRERAIDNLLLSVGSTPISNESRVEIKSKNAKAEEMRRELEELFAGETGAPKKDWSLPEKGLPESLEPPEFEREQVVDSEVTQVT